VVRGFRFGSQWFAASHKQNRFTLLPRDLANIVRWAEVLVFGGFTFSLVRGRGKQAECRLCGEFRTSFVGGTTSAKGQTRKH
jgi:hypothetical protein